MKRANQWKYALFFLLIWNCSILFAETWYRGGSGPNGTTPEQDGTITQSIQNTIDAFKKSRNLKTLDVDVSTQNGIVSLAGRVNSLSLAQYLVKTAALTEGVRDVNTRSLVVEEDNPRIDDILTTEKVKSIIDREKLADGVSVSVKTINGIVYLEGWVSSQKQLSTVISRVQSMGSVARVISMLVIKPVTIQRDE